MPIDPSQIPGTSPRRLPEAPGVPLRFEVLWEKPVMPVEGGTATLLVRVIAPYLEETTRQAPLDVAFVLDRSGSMHGDKLTLAKEGVAVAVGRLRDADRTALVVYDDDVQTLQPLAAATPALKASLRLLLPGIDPGGSTYLSGGWTAGCQALARAAALDRPAPGGPRIRRVILLTDGLANVGLVDPRELGRHAGELRRRGIATTTVGVGQDFDEGLLSAMAEAGGGNFQYVADAEGLRTFFSQELLELFSVAAMGVSVTLTLPPGLDAELVSAFPADVTGPSLEVAIGDVPAADEIDLIFTIRAGEGRLGELLPVGMQASWTDPGADARQQATLDPLPLRRAEANEINETSADMLVAERGALQRAAAERRKGLELDRQGRFAESRQHMARSVAQLRAAPRTDLVGDDLDISMFLEEAPADTAYGSHTRKEAQFREERHRRGRLHRDLTPPSDTERD